jgi:2-polyprenyl-3-methyl-5-hydroxy-6-metoxy-1,4-benzoquinol methylase
MHVKFKNSILSRIGFKLLGIPHMGLRLRARKIIKNVPISKKMLDAGCGSGIYSFSLADRIESIKAVDISNEKIDYTRNVNPFKNIYFEVGDLRKLKFKNNSFDLIICSDVLEHIKEDVRAFSELARVLMPGGRILLTVPYASKKNRMDYKKYGHERPGYDEKNIEKLCRKNSLHILKEEKYSSAFTERLSNLNYKLIDHKILLGLLFYPLYATSILADRISKKSKMVFS